MSDLTITMAETGATLSLPTGDVIVLRLPEIGGTAYLWHLAKPENFTVLSDSYDTSESAPGGENFRLLRLQPEQPGTHELRLDRHRPWESPDGADASFHVSIVAH